MLRLLDDGRAFTIVKRFRTDAELVHALGRAGIAATPRSTPTYFQLLIGSSEAHSAR
jgi:hypothetical protein